MEYIILEIIKDRFILNLLCINSMAPSQRYSQQLLLSLAAYRDGKAERIAVGNPERLAPLRMRRLDVRQIKIEVKTPIIITVIVVFLLAATVLGIRSCQRSGWESSLYGPYPGEAFTDDLTNSPVSVLPITSIGKLEVYEPALFGRGHG